MTGRIIPLHADQHEDSNALLPWYVTGRLDADDRARVDSHLKTCAQCQADLVAERRLHAAFAADGEAVGDVDAGWAGLRRRLGSEPVRGAGRIAEQWRSSAPWLRWTIAAQLALLAVGLVALWNLRQAPAPAAAYHALGAGRDAAAGNVVVVFRPDISESALRQTLREARARLVDGPTAADAYVLAVPVAGRDLTVAKLRQDRTILLAEPVDSGAAP